MQALSLAPEEVAVLKKAYSFIHYAVSPNGTPKDVLRADARVIGGELAGIIRRHTGSPPPPPEPEIEVGQTCTLGPLEQPGCDT